MIFKSIFDTAESYLKDINDDRILLLLPSVFILIFLAGDIRLLVIWLWPDFLPLPAIHSITPSWRRHHSSSIPWTSATSKCSSKGTRIMKPPLLCRWCKLILPQKPGLIYITVCLFLMYKVGDFTMHWYKQHEKRKEPYCSIPSI